MALDQLLDDQRPDAAPAPAPAPVYVNLKPGDRFPVIHQRSGAKEKYAFDTLAGRYLLYCFFLSGSDHRSQAALSLIEQNEQLFALDRCLFIGVSCQIADEANPQLKNRDGLLFMSDRDCSASKLVGAAPVNSILGAPFPARRCWIVVDPTAHVLRIFPFGEDKDHSEVLAFIKTLPPPALYAGMELPAPILVIPNVLEPSLCTALIDLYNTVGGTESGVIRDGAAVLHSDFKVRQDVNIDDGPLRAAVRANIVRRVIPEIERLFFMKISMVERYIVARYAAQDCGHFGPHRDNNPGITAHRRYALSINLNDDFEGGEVVFPEYGMRGYKVKAGWAVVFPCAALHQVNQVTSGARYAFLPFLYDEGGDRIRVASTPPN